MFFESHLCDLLPHQWPYPGDLPTCQISPNQDLTFLSALILTILTIRLHLLCPADCTRNFHFTLNPTGCLPGSIFGRIIYLSNPSFFNSTFGPLFSHKLTTWLGTLPCPIAPQFILCFTIMSTNTVTVDSASIAAFAQVMTQAMDVMKVDLTTKLDKQSTDLHAALKTGIESAVE